MVTFSETRSALRAVVGYDEEDMIEAQVSLHDQKKEAFETYLKDIESTMVFPQAKEAYNTLVTDLDGYWDIDAEVLELATSSSDDGYLKAQEIDTGELSPQYDKIYQDLATLMDLNVQKGDASKASLHGAHIYDRDHSGDRGLYCDFHPYRKYDGCRYRKASDSFGRTSEIICRR